MKQVSGWLAALVMVAAGLVFVPFALYVWASSGPEPSGAAARPVAEDVAVTGCRIDPASRRVLARVEVVSRTGRPGSYVVTVEFRQGGTGGSGATGSDVPVQSLVRVAAVRPGEVGQGEAVGPAWPAGVVPWCGVASVELSPTTG
ncbi:hypothetical protein ABT084_05590 [Streptomyces sp. NPDC002138]|uniref:hypothetical protein n=1 Tax=Streptomyces sp. NPDC002138 TaxID=3154410 RepID=UPI0033191797